MEKNKKINLKILLELALSYLKIGLFTFGGGLAMISLIEHEYVQRRKWIEKDEFENVVAIAESTPGPIAINCATYIGYKMCGVLGSIVATVAVCLPSFIIIYLISMFLDNFFALTMIVNAFKGIKIAVGILILDAALTMIKKMHKKKWTRAIMACSCLIMLCSNFFALNFSSISLMLISAIISLTLFILNSGSSEQKGDTKK